MSLSTAQQLAWSLATSLMVCITLFKTDAGYGVLPTDEFDGDPTLTVLRPVTARFPAASR